MACNLPRRAYPACFVCLCVLIITKVSYFLCVCLFFHLFKPFWLRFLRPTTQHAGNNLTRLLAPSPKPRSAPTALATFCALSCFNDAPSTTTTATTAGRTRTRAIKCYESCHLWDHYKHSPPSPTVPSPYPSPLWAVVQVEFSLFSCGLLRLEALKTFSALS